MDRTAELLLIAGLWAALARSTQDAALRKVCLDQRQRAMDELLDHRTALHEARTKVLV